MHVNASHNTIHAIQVSVGSVIPGHSNGSKLSVSFHYSPLDGCTLGTHCQAIGGVLHVTA